MFRVWDKDTKDYVNIEDEIILQTFGGNLYSYIDGRFIECKDYELERHCFYTTNGQHVFEYDVVGIHLANGDIDKFVVVYEEGTPMLVSTKGKLPLKLDLSWDFESEDWSKNLEVLGQYRNNPTLREETGVILEIDIEEIEELQFDNIDNEEEVKMKLEGFE